MHTDFTRYIVVNPIYVATSAKTVSCIWAQDLTPKQRAKRQQLVKELREREKNGEKSLLIVDSHDTTSHSNVSTATPTTSYNILFL